MVTLPQGVHAMWARERETENTLVFVLASADLLRDR